MVTRFTHENSKQCFLCKTIKVLSDFDKKGDKHDSYCKPCKSIYQKERYHSNIEINRKKARERHHKNKERNNSRSRLYWANNLEKCRAQNKINYAKNKENRKKSFIHKAYGLSPEKYEEMKKIQNELCKICNKIPDHGKGKSFHVDHCHKTGKVRGLLCAKCNVGLGAFGDNIEIMSQAINYLKENT